MTAWPVFMSASPRSDWGRSLERFSKGSGLHSLAVLPYTASLNQKKGEMWIHSPILAEWEKKRRRKKPWMYPCIRHIYSHTCCLAHTHTHTPVQSVIPCREMIEKRKLTTQMESPSQVEMFWSLFGSKSKPKSFKVLSRSLTVGLCVINVAGCGGNLWLVGGRVLNGEWNHLLIQLSLQHSGFFFVCCLSFSDVGGEQQVYGQRFLSWLTRFLCNSFSQLWSR